MIGDETAAKWSEEWMKRTPVGRFCTPAELGDFVALLVSEKQAGAGWMQGSDVIVDGGYTLF